MRKLPLIVDEKNKSEKNVNVWLIAIHQTLALSQYTVTVSTQFTVRVRSQI